MRVLDKLRSLNDYLKSLESVELDDSGMVWIEELSNAAMSAGIAVENFINKTQQFHKRSWIRPFGFGKSKYENKLAVKMDKIYTKIQNLSIHRPPTVNPQDQSCNPSDRIPSQQTMPEPNLASFGDDVNAIIARLLTEDKSFGVISVRIFLCLPLCLPLISPPSLAPCFPPSLAPCFLAGFLVDCYLELLFKLL